MDGLDSRSAHATVEFQTDAAGSPVVRIAGDLDLASVPSVELEIEPCFASDPDRLVFDLAGVTFMDSSGIAMLLRVSERVGSVAVRDPSDAVQLIIRATGLSEVLHVDA